MPSRRNRGLALLYIAVLIPSALLTLAGQDIDEARQLISFNLSGPLSLALCVMFFSNVKISHRDLRWLMYAVIGPVTGIAILGLFSVLTHKSVEFINASNTVAAGGFGPNQVSSALGLGLMFTLLLLMERKVPLRLRVLLIGLAVFFAGQSALTFSRSGVALALGGALAAGVFLLRDRRARITLIALAALLFAAGKFVIVPELEDFTQNKIDKRYSELDSNGRMQIAEYDLEIFEDHPVLGVGPGMATALREEMGHFAAAHTEFTRLLAEHGLAGAFAIMVLIVLGTRTIRATPILRYRALVYAMLTWTGLFMMVNGMRIVAPSFVVGMACTIAFSFKPPPRPRLAKTS